MGFYAKLNEAIEQHYIAQGVRRITRMTLTGNTRMQHFLEKEGYQPVRIFYEKWLSDDGQQANPLKLTKPVD
jgi:hypothetical protein